ncbi:secretin and TonB N-terminal domain-containing protein [PVC group bacterium]|nr:secretin and TonB N-terminal domain-containing protein [PVC group bacterium]
MRKSVKNLLFITIFCTLLVSAENNISAEDTSLLSMDLKDAPIANVLRMLSKQNDMNIILGPGVEGNVTVHFTEVTLAEALRSIVEVNGYTYTYQGNIIRVTTLEDREREPMQTQIYRLNNALASQVDDIIVNMLSSQGQVSADDRSNKLIVTDIPSTLRELDKVIRELDSPTRQVMIEAKMIETTLDKDENLGIDWTIRAAVSGAARPVTYPFWSEGAPRGHSSSTFMPDPFPAAIDSLFTFGTLDFSEMRAVLDILKRRGDTKILSNPRILTLDNQMASIHVGQTIPFPTYERNDTTGEFEITGFEDSTDLGITLEVTPHITNDGFVILDLHPSIKDILAFTGPVDFQRPITSNREARTRVKIRDGETVVIGGLLKDQNIVVNNKVPLLGSVPVIGHLFKHKTDQTDKTDLLIFVTVNIVKDRDKEPFAAHQVLSAAGDVLPQGRMGDIAIRENHTFK